MLFLTSRSTPCCKIQSGFITLPDLSSSHELRNKLYRFKMPTESNVNGTNGFNLTARKKNDLYFLFDRLKMLSFVYLKRKGNVLKAIEICSFANQKRAKCAIAIQIIKPTYTIYAIYYFTKYRHIHTQLIHLFHGRQWNHATLLEAGSR